MRKQLLLISSIFLLAFTSLTRAQVPDRDSVVLPQPVGGWESLDTLIVYPRILQIAGVEGIYEFTLDIDTLGNAKIDTILALSQGWSQVIEPGYSTFLELFPDVKWIPAKNDGKAINFRLYLPVVFYLNDVNKDRAPHIFKKGKTHKIEMDHYGCY